MFIYQVDKWDDVKFARIQSWEMCCEHIFLTLKGKTDHADWSPSLIYSQTYSLICIFDYFGTNLPTLLFCFHFALRKFMKK